MPFYQTQRRRRPTTDSDAAADELANFRRRIAHFSVPGYCAHCYRPDACDGPWHLFLECEHVAFQRLRLRLFSSMPHVLKQLLARLHEAHAVAGQPLPPATRAAQRASLALLLAGMDWTSADGKHVIYHMLTALPWPQRAAAQAAPATPLSAWLGARFDAGSFQRRHRRRIANHIIKWAHYWISVFADKRAGLQQADT